MEMEMVNDGPERVEATEGGVTVNQDPSSEPTVQAIRNAEPPSAFCPFCDISKKNKKKKLSVQLFLHFEVKVGT